MRLSQRICWPYCVISSWMSDVPFNGIPRYYFTFTRDEMLDSKYKTSGAYSSALAFVSRIGVKCLDQLNCSRNSAEPGRKYGRTALFVSTLRTVSCVFPPTRT